jgi:hypothetical protein
MYVGLASAPGTAGGSNEDLVLATPRIVVVADGTGVPAEFDSGCMHGTAWYVSQLVTQIAACEASAPTADLPSILAEALTAVASAHVDTCDLTADGTPSATVAVLRIAARELDYLVLSDATIALDMDSKTQVISDDRIAGLFGDLRQAVRAAPVGTPEREARLLELVTTQRRLRNVDGGYWVAGAAPDAAQYAITGRVPLADVRSAAAMTDGAARLVDVFGAFTWDDALAELRACGPAGWIERTRAIEETDPSLINWPRYKKSDDAAIAYIDFCFAGPS